MLRRRAKSWVWGVAIGLALLPFYALCWYARPSADDFLTANLVREHGHWGYLSYMYQHWTGRYTAALCWSLLSPVSYGYVIAGYGLMCLLLLLGLPFTLYALLRGLLGAAFTRWQLALGSGGLLLLITFQLPSTAEGFYWLTSAFNYLLPALLTLLMLAAVARHTVAAGRARAGWLILAAVLTVLAVGGNETTALVLLAGWLAVTGLLSWSQRGGAWPYAAVAVATTAACAVAFLAPGNFARLAGNPQYYSVAQTGLFAAKTSIYYLLNWLGNGVLLAVTLLLLPLSARLARLPELPLNYLTRFPWLLTLSLPVLLTAGQVVAFWATGMESPPRVRNVQYLFFVVGWFLSVHGWVRYCTQRGAILTALPGYVCWTLQSWLMLALLTDHNVGLRNPGWLSWRHNGNNTIVAYREWLDGTAGRYDAQLRARYHYLRTTSAAEVCVPRLQDPPRTLLFSDITDNPGNWANRAYAEFFGKRRLCLEPAATKP